MLSFKQYCEEFIQFDSQIARKGSGPSVSGAAKNGITQKPAQVETAVIGDNTSFSGNNTYLVKNIDIPFKFGLKKKDGQYHIYIQSKGDTKFIPLNGTKFNERMDCSFDEKEDALSAIRDLKFRISQVDISKK